MSQEKLVHLKRILRELDRVAVAYSGGTDSTLLLRVAHDCLGDAALALTAVSPSVPATDLADAQAVARQIGARHVLLESHETEDARYLSNTPERCYFCRHIVFDQLLDFARRAGYPHLVDGANADDVGDHRPGRRAARELGVRSPLQEAGFTKTEIRAVARELGLPNWDMPSAACLSSRIPYGARIDVEMLSQVAQAESQLKQMGFRQVRVRHHDQVARIEVPPDDFPALLAGREQIIERLKSLGYTYVTLDLAGFRSGSLNELLPRHGR